MDPETTDSRRSLRLRRATRGDYEFVYAVKKSGYREHVEATFGAWDEAFQRENFRANFAPERIQIVEVAGRPVGILELIEEPGQVRVKNLALVAEHRGVGLGTRLLEGVLSSHERVVLRVLKANVAARRFYERVGFRAVRDAGHWWEMARDGSPTDSNH